MNRGFGKTFAVLLITGLLVIGCDTKVVEKRGATEFVILPEDFSEMVGSPSFYSSSLIYFTYVNKKGEYVTQGYYSDSMPDRIIWVKPESQE